VVANCTAPPNSSDGKQPKCSPSRNPFQAKAPSASCKIISPENLHPLWKVNQQGESMHGLLHTGEAATGCQG
jgi:hypothetical protein